MIDPGLIFLLGDPAQMRICFDDWAVRINHDDFEPVIPAVLGDPIRVKDNEIDEFPLSPFFRKQLVVFPER